MDDQAFAGFLHRLFHSLDVERDERAQVEDLGVNAMLASTRPAATWTMVP